MQKTSNILYKHLGATVYQNVVNAVGSNIVVKKEMVLDELHIYGSSGHGINKPNVTLVNKTYKLNNIDSATDSSMAMLNYKYFKRTLTFKQYELTNHLGNVLATVLDRKTFVGSDTLEYYAADVYTAGLYYAFGGGIEEMQYKSDTTNNYRYTFNGKETDTETDLQDYGFRIYNPNIGKFLSVDPLSAEFPWNSTYAFAENDVIRCIDLEGAEAYVLTQKFDPYGNFITSTLIWDEKAKPLPDNKIYYVHITQIIYDRKVYEIRKQSSQDIENIVYYGKRIDPTQCPSSIYGTTKYYKWRNQDFIVRETLFDKWYTWQPDAPTYYLEYGDKYIHRFTNDVRPKLSSAGQEWLDNALLNLQKAIENELGANNQIELDNEKFTQFAFKSHVPAYENAGLFNLPLSDLIIIGTTPDLLDLLSENGRDQVLTIIGDYKKDLEEKLKNAADDAVDAIIQEAREYVISVLKDFINDCIPSIPKP